MGFAIKRKDGTYRGWIRYLQPGDDVRLLRHQETLEEMETPPLIIPDLMSPAEKDVAAGKLLDENRMLKAIMLWAADKLGVAPGQARAEIITFYRGLE